MPALRVCRISLTICAVVGASLMLAAILIVPSLAYFQLDRVLTPEQLADPQTREATLVLLKKAGGNMWLVWFGAGLAVAVSAGVGLIASFRRTV